MNSDARLLQFSDPHLFADPQGRLRGVQTLASLQRVLAHASGARRRLDAVLCTGDIVNDEPEGYAHFVNELRALGKPVYCVPGNHDEPARMRAALSAPPATGMIVAPAQTQAVLSSAARARLQPRQTYFWRVQAIGADGRVIGEGPVRRLTVP